MAELFGIFAGGVSLTALAVQLIESAEKLTQLHRRYKDTPQYLKDIAEDLNIYSQLLRQIEIDRVTYNTIEFADVSKCIAMCQKAVGHIIRLIEKIEAAMAKSNKLGRMRTAFKTPEIFRLRDEIQSEKSSLFLAWTIYREACRRSDHAHDAAALSVHSGLLQQICDALDVLTARALIQHVEEATSGNEHFKSKESLSSNGSSRRTGRWQGATTLQFSLRPWFVSRIWHLTLDTSYAGWNLTIRTANCVPRNSLIIDLCAAGDLVGVQRLFENGLADPWDYVGDGSNEHKALEVSTDCDNSLGRDNALIFLAQGAINNGHLELCRYMINLVGAPPMRDDPLGLLIAGVRDDSKTYEMWRLLNEHYPFSRSVAALQSSTDKTDLADWWICCPDVSFLKIIKSELPFVYDDLPWSTRFENAMSAGLARRHYRFPFRPEMFLAMLGCKHIDHRLVSSLDRHGNSVLHMALGNVAEWSTSWGNFLRDVLLMGVKPHVKNKAGETPLDQALDVWITDNWQSVSPTRSRLMPDPSIRRTLTPKVQRLINDMSAAKIDLQQFGEEERAHWMSTTSGLFSKRYKIEPESVTWTIGPATKDWSLEFNYAPIKIWLLEARPAFGSWPEEIESWQKYTCWAPRTEDELPPGFEWYMSRETNIKAPVALEMDKATATTIPHWSPWDVFSRAQDDCGIVQDILYRQRKSPPLRRAQSHSHMSSRPALAESTRSYEVFKAHRLSPRIPWILILDYCHLLGRLVFVKHPFKDSECNRRCLIHRHAIDESGQHPLWSWNRGIDRNLDIFRYRYRGKDELESLPYAAYHPEWRLS